MHLGHWFRACFQYMFKKSFEAHFITSTSITATTRTLYFLNQMKIVTLNDVSIMFYVLRVVLAVNRHRANFYWQVVVMHLSCGIFNVHCAMS